MTLALVDGDIVAFRCAIAGQSDFDWGDGVHSNHSCAQSSADAACSLVDAWTSLAGCKDKLVTFTGKNNFRYRVLPTYKANRAGKVKPLAYTYTVEAITKRFPTQLVDGLEADDLMGILATTLPKYQDAVVLTIDKDLRGVPGTHMNPIKDKFPVEVTEAQADYYWLLQTLMGDVTDGYTGIPGVGPKKAEKILTGVPTVPVMWAKVAKAYADAGLTEADALQQARVARILRRSDYDKATKEVLLWHPTTPVRLPCMPSTEPAPTTSAASAT